MRIAILTGGTGAERDVALRSAETFKENMDAGYGFFILPDEMDRFLSCYKDFDLAVPVFHGEYGEDGRIFGMLDCLGVRHCFSPFVTHAICMDKNKTNILVEKIGIKTPQSHLVASQEELENIALNFPLIVKPNSGGSSVATYKVMDQHELESAVKDVIELTSDLVLIQEFITGTEYSVPIIGNDDPEVLPIMKVALKTGDFFDYDEKYNSDGSNEIFGDIDDKLEQRLTTDSKMIYSYLGCRGISRIDYIVNGTGAYFLEVNTIPGFSSASIFPKAWELTGRNLEKLVKKVLILGSDNK